jgi:hypothetical protein
MIPRFSGAGPLPVDGTGTLPEDGTGTASNQEQQHAHGRLSLPLADSLPVKEIPMIPRLGGASPLPEDDTGTTSPGQEQQPTNTGKVFMFFCTKKVFEASGNVI